VNDFERPFSGWAVGLSISDSDDSAALGFPDWQVNRITLHVVSALLGQGASVVFGHDWRDDGVMEAVHGLALRTEPSVPANVESQAFRPLLENILPWPEVPALSDADRERLASTVRITQAGLPGDLQPFEREAREGADRRSPLFRYCRSRALTHLRRELDARIDARICIGGRRRGSAGRYPGVIEEALFAVQNRRPLYVVGLLGGASRQIGEALVGKPMPDDFCPATAVTELYRNTREILGGRGAEAAGSDGAIDREQVWQLFKTYGLSKFAAAAGLSEELAAELLGTPVVDRAIQLILSGLARVFVRPGNAS